MRSAQGAAYGRERDEGWTFEVSADLSARQVDVLLAGGMLTISRSTAKECSHGLSGYADSGGRHRR